MASVAPLRTATQALYAAFARYPLAAHVSACPHCVDETDHGRLYEAPLSALSGAALSRYAFKALTTWGTAADFKHFLPRLFALLAEGDRHLDPEVLIGKLALASWGEWPVDERAAVRAFLLAWWREILSGHPGVYGASACLRAIGRAEEDLSPYLSAWQRDPGLPATLHLADLVLENQDALWRTGAVNRAGWLPRQRAQISDWLRDESAPPSRRERLEQSFFACGGQTPAEVACARELSGAYECLDGVRRASG